MVPRGGTLLALVALALAIALGFRAASPRPPPRDAAAASSPENCATATDWQCFSSGRRERQVDETFAGYVARASFAAIMEDPQVGGVDPNTGETDEAIAQAFVRRVTVLYEGERKKLGLGKAAPRDAKDDAMFPPLEELKSPEAFDAYSYAQFAAAAETLAGGRERRALTERVGKRILLLLRQITGVEATGDPSDFKHMQRSLDDLLGAFAKCGYVLDSGLVWPEDAEAVYAKTRELTFQYWMRDPVILPSARRLFREQGFAQHFSSRTIEGLFAGYGVVAREDSDFDPREWPDDRVVEQWTLKAGPVPA